MESEIEYEEDDVDYIGHRGRRSALCKDGEFWRNGLLRDPPSALPAQLQPHESEDSDCAGQYHRSAGPENFGRALTARFGL